MKKGSLLGNVVVLTCGALLSRALGMVLRIYLSGRIGEYGMGVYSLILSLFTLGSVLGSAGISAAVSKIAAEELALGNRAGVRRLMRVTGALSLFMGSAASLLFSITAKPLALHFVDEKEAALGIFLISLSFPFMAVSSALKGYLYAANRAKKTALSLLVEQLVKLAAIIPVMEWYHGNAIRITMAVLAVSMVLGEAFSCIYLYKLYRKSISKQKGEKPRKQNGMLTRLLRLSVPMGLTSYIISGFRAVENMLIPLRLQQYGTGKEDAISVYGVVKGMVMPLLTFPSAVITSVAVLLVPEIAGSMAAGRKEEAHRKIRLAIKYTSVLSLLLSPLFFAFSGEIGAYIFRSEQAGAILKNLSFLCPFIYLEMVCQSILQSLGEQLSSLRYNLLDSSMRILLVWFFLPVGGVTALMVVIILSNLLTAVLTVSRLLKVVHMKPDLMGWVTKPLLASMLSVFLSERLSRLFEGNLLMTALCAGAGALLYLVFLRLSGCISLKELRFMKGQLRRKR